MSYCRKCGKQVSDQDKFCLNCGAQLNVHLFNNILFTHESKPTRFWYVIAFFFNIFGGIIGYFAVKDDDQQMANNLLIVGFFSILFLFFIIIFGIPLLFIPVAS